MSTYDKDRSKQSSYDKDFYREPRYGNKDSDPDSTSNIANKENNAPENQTIRDNLRAEAKKYGFDYTGSGGDSKFNQRCNPSCSC